MNGSILKPFKESRWKYGKYDTFPVVFVFSVPDEHVPEDGEVTMVTVFH